MDFKPLLKNSFKTNEISSFLQIPMSKVQNPKPKIPLSQIHKRKHKPKSRIQAPTHAPSPKTQAPRSTFSQIPMPKTPSQAPTQAPNQATRAPVPKVQGSRSKGPREGRRAPEGLAILSLGTSAVVVFFSYFFVGERKKK